MMVTPKDFGETMKEQYMAWKALKRLTKKGSTSPESSYPRV